MDVDPGDETLHLVQVVVASVVSIGQLLLLARVQLLQESVDQCVERRLLLAVLRKHRQTVAGVIHDVTARREAATSFDRVRMSNRHVFVDALATFESFVELLACVLAQSGRRYSVAFFLHRAVAQLVRKLQAERKSGVVHAVRDRSAVVDASAEVHDLLLDALVLAIDEGISERPVRRFIGAVAVRWRNAYVLAGLDSDRNGEPGRNVVSVGSGVRHRARRVDDYSSALTARHRWVGQLQPRHNLVRRRVGEAASDTGEEEKRQSVLDSGQTRRSGFDDRVRLEGETVEVERIKDLDKALFDVAALAHEATVDDVVLDLNSGFRR